MKIKSPKHFAEAVRALQEILTEKLDEGCTLTIHTDPAHVNLTDPDGNTIVDHDLPEAAANFLFE